MYLSLRDIESAEEDRRLLARYGISLLPCPMQDVTYRPHAELRLKDAGGILLTSPKAALALPPSDAHARPVFCVGRRTAALAREKGYRDVWAGPDNAAALAEAMRQRPVPNHILWLRGDRVSFDFASALAGVCQIEAQTAYELKTRAHLPEAILAAFAAGRIKGVMGLSQAQVEIFDRLLDAAPLAKWREDIPLFVISHRVAEAAHNWTNIVISRRKRPVSVRAAIACYDRQQRIASA